MIWDLHCHIATVPGRTPDERMARFIEFADRMGIERLCIYMGQHWNRDPSVEDMRAQNDDVLQALSHWHHRAFGFVYLNPNHVEASLQEIDRCIGNGPMVGVKLWVARRCNAKELDPIVEAAAKLKAVIFQHTWLKAGGNDPGESTPSDLAELAVRHPAATFICGHSGGDWERGLRAIRANKNIYTDLAGFDPTAGVTEMAVRELGADRVLYGSDAGGRSFASQLGKVLGAAISGHDRKLILGGNLKRLLTPILREKGVAL
jgi:predicted TIM-barrel fold metal-dependent hydrolase